MQGNLLWRMAQYDYWPRYGVENYTFLLPFEGTFDSVSSTQWMQRNWHHSFTASAIYIIAIFGGQKLMEGRKPFALDVPLFFWNLTLAIFSILGFVRMTPEWIWSWSAPGNSFAYSICTASFAQGVTGFWTELFAMSKIAELFDTAFIVLRKKPLLFLHWYHHITVLCYNWHAYKDHTASGRWFQWMNFGVHAFMYSYYAIRAAKLKVPKFCAMLITLGQIAQMVMGVTIGVFVYNIKSAGGACQQTWDNLYYSFTIYFTYGILFCNFFYHAYIKKNNRYTAVPADKKGGKKTENKVEEKVAVEEKATPSTRPTRRRVVKAE